MSQWASVEIAGERPAPLHMHASARHPAGIDALVVHGGRQEDLLKKSHRVGAEMFYVSLVSGESFSTSIHSSYFNREVTGKPSWTRVQVKTGSLPARYGHTMCPFQARLFIFGGVDENGVPSNDLHVVDLNTMSVTLAKVAPGSACPPPRSDHSMLTSLSTGIMIFGGKTSGDTLLDDVWCGTYEVVAAEIRWKLVETEGTKPSPRANAVTFLCNQNLGGRMAVMGGQVEGRKTTNDLYTLDLATFMWVAHSPSGEIPPATQLYHGTLLDDFDCLMLVGEKGPLRTYHLKNVSTLSDNFKWETHKASGALPATASFCLGTFPAIFVPQVCLIGGYPSPKDGLSVWTLDLNFLVDGGDAASSGTVATESSDGSSGAKAPKGGKYGTLKNMFKRKDASLPASSPVIPVVNLPLPDSTPGTPTSVRASSRRNSTMRGSQEPPKEDGIYSSPASPKLRDLSARRAKASLSSEGARSRSGTQEWLPSPKASLDVSQLQSTLAETQESLRIVQAELEAERKLAAQARADPEGAVKSDSALLMRKALDEEVRNGQIARERIHTLEAENAAALHQITVLKAQLGEQKAQTAALTSQGAVSEAKIQQLEESLREVQASRQKYQDMVSKKLMQFSQLEKGRLDGCVATLQARHLHHGTRRIIELVDFLRLEYFDIIRSVALPDHAALRVQRLEDETAVRLRQCKIELGLEQSKDFSLVSQESEEQEQGSDTTDSTAVIDDSETVPLSPKAGLKDPGTPVAEPLSPSSSSSQVRASAGQGLIAAQIAKHTALLKEVEKLNKSSTSHNVTLKTRPMHQGSEEIYHSMQKQRALWRGQPAALSWLVPETLLLETHYIDYLEAIVAHYHDPLIGHFPDLARGMFGNIPDILPCHKALLGALRSVTDDPVSFFSIYAQQIPSLLNEYDKFLALLPEMILCYHQAGRKERIKNFLADQTSHSHILDLKAALLRPLLLLHSYWEIFSVMAELDKTLAPPLVAQVQSPPQDALLEESPIPEVKTTTPQAPPNPISQVAGLGRSLSQALPIDTYRDAAENAMSQARLLEIERLMGETASMPVSGGRRVHFFDASFILREANLEWEGVFSAPIEVTAVLCSDALFLVIPGENQEGSFRLHEVIPMDQLVHAKSPVSSDKSVRFAHRARPSIQYQMFGSDAHVKQMDALISDCVRAMLPFTKDLQGRDAAGSGGGEAGTLEDSSSIIYIREGASVTVRGGLPSALLQWIILDIPESPTLADEQIHFLHSCYKDIPPKLIFETLREYIRRPAASLTERERCLRFASLWVGDFGIRDLMVEGSNTASPLFQDVLKWGSALDYPGLTGLINRLKLAFIRVAGRAKELSGRPKLSSAPLDPLDEEDLQECHPRLWADQLTLVVHDLFAALTDDDLYVGDKSPNVVAMINLNNAIFEWTISYINHGAGGPEDAAKLGRVKRMLIAAQRVLELRNYDSAFALALAFDQSKISKTVREALKKMPEQRIWDNLTSITNFSRNFFNYRSIVDNLAAPAIPYLALALKDIVLIRENDSKIENTDMLNYRKIVILGARLHFLQRYRSTRYRELAPHLRAQHAFRGLKPIPKPAEVGGEGDKTIRPKPKEMVKSEENSSSSTILRSTKDRTARKSLHLPQTISKDDEGGGGSGAVSPKSPKMTLKPNEH